MNVNVRDYRLEVGWQFRRIDRKLLIHRHPHRIARALTTNLDRVSSLMYLLPSLAFWTQVDQQTGDIAALEVFGTLKPTPEQLRTPGVDQRIWKVQAGLQLPLLETTKKDMRVVNAKTHSVASEYLPQLLRRFGDWLGPGVDSVLAAGLSGAWTAFEVLAKDLWMEALDQRPTILAYETLKSHHKEHQFDAYKEEAESSRKSASVWVRDKCQVHFNSTNGIRSAYEAAFGQSMNALFERKRFRRMEVLQSVRNLLVHQGGIVDGSFVKRVQRNRELFGSLAGLQSGQHLLLDGELVQQLASTSSFCCAALLIRVYRWLQAHPKA